MFSGGGKNVIFHSENRTSDMIMDVLARLHYHGRCSSKEDSHQENVVKWNSKKVMN